MISWRVTKITTWKMQTKRLIWKLPSTVSKLLTLNFFEFFAVPMVIFFFCASHICHIARKKIKIEWKRRPVMQINALCSKYLNGLKVAAMVIHLSFSVLKSFFPFWIFVQRQEKRFIAIPHKSNLLDNYSCQSHSITVHESACLWRKQ